MTLTEADNHEGKAQPQVPQSVAILSGLGAKQAGKQLKTNRFDTCVCTEPRMSFFFGNTHKHSPRAQQVPCRGYVWCIILEIASILLIQV